MQKKNKGITLIALIITIIVLLILAGIVIGLAIGENGIINKVRQAAQESEKELVREEIQIAVMGIQTHILAQSREFTMQDVVENLPDKLNGLTIEQNQLEAIGEYKDYDYIITQQYEVIIEGKMTGEKPIITYALSTQEIGVNSVTITVNASVENGEIDKIIKPDGSQEKKDKVTYEVTKSGKYRFIAETSNGRRASCLVPITNIIPSEPVIESEGRYAVITDNGITESDVTIIYDDNDELNNYYSEDDGVTWKIYNGPFKPTSNIIKAKSEFKDNPSIKAESTKDVIPKNAIGPKAYDGNDSTSIPGISPSLLLEESQYLLIDKSAIGMQMTVKWGSISGAYCYARIYILDKDDNILYKTNSAVSGNVTTIIPENAAKFAYCGQVNTRLNEVTASGINTINIHSSTYQKLTTDGIINGDDKTVVTIDYWHSCVQKLYKINDDEWKEYSNSPIELNNGDIIYAKGINNSGGTVNEISLKTYDNTAVLSPEIYDNNSETSKASQAGCYVFVEENMRGKQIYVKANGWSGSWCYYSIIALDKEGNQTTMISNKTLFSGNLTIPQNTIYLKIGCQTNAAFYEIQPVR